MEENITISAKEYKELLEASVRIKIFEDYVNREKYSINREDCGIFLGFEVVGAED